MRLIICLLAILTICPAFATQRAGAYAPKQGETVLKIDIEGRGTIYVHLHTKEAPQTTAHILNLVRSKFYDGQRFFKVVKSPRPYLVQIGDPNTKTQGVDGANIGLNGSGTRIPYEDSGFSNEEGAVGLSTLPKDKDSGDSQFYMLLAPAPFLDGNYTVFGKVVQGLDIMRKIEKGDRVTSITILGK